MPTFTDEELKTLTDANILRGSTWGKAIDGASATTGHALTTDAGQSWVSNVTPATIDAYGFSVTNPATLPHWSDDFAPLPVIDPGMLESRSEREDTIARIWDGMVTAMTLAQKPETHSAVLAALQDACIYGTGWVGVDFASAYKQPGATNAAAYAGARDSDCAGIDAYLADEKRLEAADADLLASHYAEQAKPPSRVKPAITGLGVTAPEDHRLGRWKA